MTLKLKMRNKLVQFAVLFLLFSCSLFSSKIETCLRIIDALKVSDTAKINSFYSYQNKYIDQHEIKEAIKIVKLFSLPSKERIITDNQFGHTNIKFVFCSEDDKNPTFRAAEITFIFFSNTPNGKIVFMNAKLDKFDKDDDFPEFPVKDKSGNNTK